MYLSRLKISNWRNFNRAELVLGETTFIIGPNASGKSNLLDVFRFLRDIVKPTGGGLQQSLELRGGLKKVRSLSARNPSNVEITVEMRSSLDDQRAPPDWTYELSVGREKGGKHRPIVDRERVLKGGKEVLKRPRDEDKRDKARLGQTHLEQITMNESFREVAEFFSEVLYLHLVPQLLRYAPNQPLIAESDPFGQRFLEIVAGTPQRSRDSRLRRVEEILTIVIPNLAKLRFARDEVTGRPHLEMRYNHWRAHGSWQREDQFSDGTLRMIALMWSLLSSDNLILLEEPELSLHAKVVEQIPRLIYDARKSRKKSGGQILVSTHSPSMLSSTSIEGNFVMLTPGHGGEGTDVLGPSTEDIAALRSGMSPADVLLPQTATSIGKI